MKFPVGKTHFFKIKYEPSAIKAEGFPPIFSSNCADDVFYDVGCDLAICDSSTTGYRLISGRDGRVRDLTRDEMDTWLYLSQAPKRF